MKLYLIKQYIDKKKLDNQSLYLDELDTHIDLTKDNGLLLIILSIWASLENETNNNLLKFNYNKNRLSEIIDIYEKYAKSRFMQVFLIGANYKKAFNLYQQVNPKLWDIKYHDDSSCVTFKERNETDKFDLHRSALSCDGVDVLILKRLKTETYIKGNYMVNRDDKTSQAIYYEILNQTPDISFEELIFIDFYKKFSRDGRVFLLKHCQTLFVSSFIKACSETVPNDTIIKNMESLIDTRNIEQFLDMNYFLIQTIKGD